jgi:hypothetical protein
MLIRCYDCFSDTETKEQVWLYAEWVSALPCGGLRFYIREDKLSFALLADSTMHALPIEDYIM